MAVSPVDPWLGDRLVCPRDRTPLAARGQRLLCPYGHAYPLVAGVPVLLVKERPPTHSVFEKTFERVAASERDVPALRPNARARQNIEFLVADEIAKTCGMLYAPLQGDLRRYPIPAFPLPRTPGVDLVLDIGCNWGRWCVSAARQGFTPVGIDPSIDAILAARRVAEQLGVRAHYVVADARALPFSAGSFDAVFSYSVLQHFSRESAVEALGEVSRVLRPGGRSLIQLPQRSGARNIYQRLRRRNAPRSIFHVRYWSRSDIRRTFQSAIGPTLVSADGFFSLNAQITDIDLLPRRYRWVVRSSDLLRRLSARVPWLTHVADSLYVHSVRNGDGTSRAPREHSYN